MKILITRHGESEANLRGIISNRDLPHHLTAAGISQSLALADKLPFWGVKQVYASPIPRARETASILAEKAGLPLSLSYALREFDCGRMEGRRDPEAWEAHQEVIRAWDEEHDYDQRIEPDGESFNDLKARFIPFFVQVLEGRYQQPGNVLMVSHGGLLHQMLPLVIENIDRAFTQQHPLGNCELVVVRSQTSNIVCTHWAEMKMTEA